MMFKNIPIVIRITIWFSVLMILIVAVMLTFMLTMSESMIEFNLQSKLKRAVDNALDEIEYDDGELEIDDDIDMFDDGIYLLIYDMSGELLLGDLPSELAIDFDFSDGVTEPVTIAGNRYYIYNRLRTFKKHDDVWVRGLMSVSSVSDAVNSFVILALTVLPILLIIAIAGGYYIAKRSFKPINKIIATVSEINEGSDLSKRINLGDGGDEIHQLANTFDDMFTRLETSFETEKQFTQDASHELRTPTAVILAQCEYTMEHENSPDEYKESIKTMQRQAEKMSRLISQLLTFTRFDNNKDSHTFEEINFSELLEIICDEQQLLNPDINMTTSIQPNVLINAERILISRLCINLISNAFTYNNKNGNVNIELSATNNTVTLTVTDDGIGIAESEINKIWNRFYRASKSRTDTGKQNLGLGLSMVKQIADLHGGIISVESELGKGSKFIFTLDKKL